MAEYIKREELMEFPIRRNHYDKKNGNKHFINGIETVLEYAENLPAADVAPVVRCRKCKHHYWVQEPCHGKTVHYCELPHMRGIEIFKEFFCSYGEQKDGDGNG